MVLMCCLLELFNVNAHVFPLFFCLHLLQWHGVKNGMLHVKLTQHAIYTK